CDKFPSGSFFRGRDQSRPYLVTLVISVVNSSYSVAALPRWGYPRSMRKPFGGSGNNSAYRPSRISPAAFSAKLKSAISQIATSFEVLIGDDALQELVANSKKVLMPVSERQPVHACPGAGSKDRRKI
ncbi:MAG: hypothetical protein ACREQ2_13215, partial [Candidatus Binatia bacterium]